MSRRGNCEDILLNIVAATAIQEHSLQPGAASSSPGGPGGRRLLLGEVEPPERRLPQAVWVQPSRRLDISLLSGVGISRAAQHAGSAAGVAALCFFYSAELAPFNTFELA